MFYEPPKTIPLPPLQAVIRTLWKGDGNLLELLPAEAYKEDCLSFGRWGTKLFNNPNSIRTILKDEKDSFVRSDTMAESLDDLVGQSIFIASGKKWKNNRAKLSPALALLKPQFARETMSVAIEEHVNKMPEGEISLDFRMAYIASDIICRTMFSCPIEESDAFSIFKDWNLFKKSVTTSDVSKLVIKSNAKSNHPKKVIEAAKRIRSWISKMVDNHKGTGDVCDIAVKEFDNKELIDELTVFFLSGHETTASVLTWMFYIYTQCPQYSDRLKTDEQFVKAWFRETLRLYPPSSVFPRKALKNVEIDGFLVHKNELALVVPWVTHRHEKYWKNPDAFIPERFMPENTDYDLTGFWVPFGYGPHFCSGAAYAQTESIMIFSKFINHFKFKCLSENVKPVHRLTTCPEKEIIMKIERL